jgi:hypothetical protein
MPFIGTIWQKIYQRYSVQAHRVLKRRVTEIILTTICNVESRELIPIAQYEHLCKFKAENEIF